MSNWKKSEDMFKKHDRAGGLYLKLANDGDKHRVVFLGEPTAEPVVFLENRYVKATEKLKAEGHRISVRFAINVALYDTREVKVLEQGASVFQSLCRAREKYSLERYAFEIQRHGAAKDPKTTYTILPEHQLSEEEQRVFQSLSLHDLERLHERSTGSGGGAVLGSYDRQSPSLIQPAAAQELVALLKALPREAAERFLQEFRIKRVKDLPAGSLEQARAFVADLAESHQSDVEIDPFA